MADSSRAVVSYWRKDVHLVLVNRLRSLPRNSMFRLTDHLHMTIEVDWDVKSQIKQTNKRCMQYYVYFTSILSMSLFLLTLKILRPKIRDLY